MLLDVLARWMAVTTQQLTAARALIVRGANRLSAVSLITPLCKFSYFVERVRCACMDLSSCKGFFRVR